MCARVFARVMDCCRDVLCYFCIVQHKMAVVVVVFVVVVVVLVVVVMVVRLTVVRWWWCFGYIVWVVMVC